MSATSGNTVILGAGIVGLSTAYFLSRSGNTKADSIHVVDSSPKLFHCASGLAGGFLASDWFAPSNASLGALSFKVHKELAEKYNGRKTWGYSLSTGISLSQDSEAAVGGSGEDWLADGTSRAQATNSKPAVGQNGPPWLKRTEDGSLEVISQQGTVGQQCLEAGVQLHQPARAISVLKDESGQLDGVRLSKEGTEAQLPCTRLLITSGAWTPRVFSTLFPKSSTRIPISSLAGHSLLLRNHHYNLENDDDEVCHAVFATDSLGFSPEWFSRIGGEIYLAGLNSTMIPLPEIATDVQANPSAIEQMKQCAAEMLGPVDGKEIEVVREALCFRPVTGSGRPLVCRVPDEKLGGFKTRGAGQGGVFIAAGHGAWGISQAPGTGLVMSELLEGRETSANISALVLPS